MAEPNNGKKTKTEKASINDNFIYGFDLVQKVYAQELERFNSADSKLNMILVFNAALVTALSFVLPIRTDDCVKSTLCYVFLSLFTGTLLASVVPIIIGLFPKNCERPALNNFVNQELYELNEIDFLGRFIQTFKGSTETLSKSSKKKYTCATISLITLLLGMVFLVCLFILNNI